MSLTRISEEHAFILHRYAWRETSLILDVFTRDYGRVAMVAKGAKRPASVLRTTLVSFCPLAVTYSGKAEVKTLSRADWLGGHAPLTGLALMAGFYCNELLIKLLAREDAHPALFDAYAQTLAHLGERQAEHSVEPLLRSFEAALLTEIGLMPPLHLIAESGAAVQPQALYRVSMDGVRLAHSNTVPDEPNATGAQLLAMAKHDYSDASVLPVAKAVMRSLLAYHLGDQPLKTRQLLIDLHNL
jgi:DNA repair protein RecO (recombination protein O)